MIVYIGAGGGRFRDLVLAAGHGQMVSRQAKSFRVPTMGRWAFDNGAYIDYTHGKSFDNQQYEKRIESLARLPEDRLPDWCVVPDIVADRTSLSYSLRWRQALADADPRLKWYLAVQDFMTFEDVQSALCLEPFDGIFIGGSTPWKKETADRWVNWGHEQGLPVHLARVNGPGPLQWAVDIGADSVDGTGWVRAYYKWLPYLENVPAPQPGLFPFDPELPPQWIRFGIYLESIWGIQDWKRWSKASCPESRLPEQLQAMSQEEFLAWLDDTYVASEKEAWRREFGALYLDEAARTPLQNEAELTHWKRWILWELERILKASTPPAPAKPQNPGR